MNLQDAIDINKENLKLWSAINKGRLTKVKEAIENGATLHTCPPIERRADDNFMQHSPLHIAAQKGWNEAIKLLVEYGADPNTSNRIQQKPVHWAAYYGHLDTIKLLISLGAELFPHDDDGETTMTWAANQGHIQVVDFLIANGGDVREQNDKDGYTALHWAAREGKTLMARHLIKKGADIKSVNTQGLTPLDIAMVYGKFATAKALKNILEDADTN